MTDELSAVRPSTTIPIQRLADEHVLRILHLEDNSADALLTQQRLRQRRSDVVFDRVQRLAELTSDRVQSADCALIDLTLPDAVGLESLQAVRQLGPDLPIIVLTGVDNVSTGLAALRDGAQDYLVKDHATGHTLDRAIRYAVERLLLERQLTRQALHDPLTGLPNRALFSDRLAQATERARRTDGFVTAMLLDLDHFKQVNDSHGHAAGDELLMQIAARLRTATRPNDTLCRLGGDEFVLLCEGLRSRAEADQLARRLLAVLQGRVQVGEHSMIPGISIGISMRDGTVEPETLLHEADRALYQAKAAGRAGIAWFSDATTATPEPERFSLDNALRDAIRTRDGLTVVYQPIIDTTSGTTVMLEALARWTHPTRGPVPPGEFVPRAEMAGVIAELDQFVLEQALGELVSRRRADEQLTVNVNVSARTLEHVGLLDRVTELLKQHHLQPSAVTFEVAETAALSPEAAASVERLQDAGCRLALDDFGSGPSSISQFIGTSADVIKIDGSLVQAAAAGNMRADMLLRLVASAAVDFDMTVVALGVQTERELALCRNAGITYAQGFLWGRS